MKPLSFLILTLLIFQSGFSQNVIFYITGDKVNIREDTTVTTPTLKQFDWGSKLSGTRVNDNWYSYEFHGDKFFVSAKYAAEADEFYEVAEQKMDRNGYTKFELLLLHKERNHLSRAESLMYDIIDENSRELGFMMQESCYLLGISSYIKLVTNQDGFLNYDDFQIFDLINRVIANSTDSVITAMALVDKTKFQMRSGEIAEAQETMLFILDHYSEKLFLPIPCDYDMESKTYPMKKFINLFVAMVYLLDTQDQREIYLKVKRMRESSDNGRTNEMLSEIYEKLNTDFWLPY